MSADSEIPNSGEINMIRDPYMIDTKSLIAEVLKAKEESLKILQELRTQFLKDTENNLKKQKEQTNTKEKKIRVPRKNRTEPTSPVSLRRSMRLQNTPDATTRDNKLSKSEPVKNHFNRPPNDYGAIPGVEIGTCWETRLECSYYCIHRPTVAGIHGGPDGAYSIALSGGYPEDVDEGHYFLYTGAGGRDLKGTATKPKNLRTAPQTKDQKLEGTNLSLVKSIESKLPVRVIRGYKLPSIFAPETGYRYDGLYQVVKYWEDVGTTGFKVYRFRLERMKDQGPAPWEPNFIPPEKKDPKGNENEFSEENSDSSEFKENIAPSDYELQENVPLDININNKEVKDVDNEIQMCIDFFCKAAVIKCSEDLGKDCNEEEFHGWD